MGSAGRVAMGENSPLTGATIEQRGFSNSFENSYWMGRFVG